MSEIAAVKVLPPVAGKRVLVLGASGYTGRKIVQELGRRNQPCALAGRSSQRLADLARELDVLDGTPCLTADPTRPETLVTLFREDTGLIINCAGPFSRLGEPVVQAAVKAGVPYLDITGEQPYLAHIITQYDAPARLKGCAVIPACGFEFSVANWAAALACEGFEQVEDLWTATAVQGIKASRGTQLSLFEALSRPGRGWHNGQPAARLAGSSSKVVNFPAPFHNKRVIWAPSGELITIPRHISVTNMNSYLAVPLPLGLTTQLAGPLLTVICQIGGQLARRVAGGPALTYQENSEWAVVAAASGARGNRQVTLLGRNVYDLTAMITCWCAAQMLKPAFDGVGVLGPAQAFDVQEAMNFLKQEAGVTCTVVDTR